MFESILDEALKAEKIIVYGAHLVALECARWIIKKGRKDSILGFAVTDVQGNPNELLKIPVKRLEAYKTIDKNLMVIIAMPERYHNEVENYVKQAGIEKVIKVSLECMSKIKGAQLLAEQNRYPQLPFVLKKSESDVSWLDMEKRNQAVYAGNCNIKSEWHCKFPTLFYMDEKESFDEASNFLFYKMYEKICGRNRSLSMLPADKRNVADVGKAKEIMSIYALFSEWDSAKTKSKQCDEWIYPLQVGSKLANQRYGNLFDDQGENISEKNRLFAELTGTYWVWKNGNTFEYKGICHYRRHFIISEKEIMALKYNNIDVLLTTPRYVPGGIKNMFLAETPVKESVFQSVLLSIKDIFSDDINCFENYIESNFYYPNNMVIAKNDVYDAYCKWIFPILFRMEEIDVETNYGHETDRHIAYAAELLTSYYFVKNREKYRIAVTDYRLLIDNERRKICTRQ